MKKQTADIWLREGLLVLAELGPDHLTLDELCQRLDLTKGAFYHHYKNRSAYIVALLEFWEHEMTSRLVEVSQREVTPLRQLRRLGELSTTQEYGQVENVLRAWASYDETVRSYQQRIDARRLTYLHELSTRLLDDPDDGLLLARIFYTMFIGSQHLVPPLSGKELQRLYRYLLRSLSGSQRPSLQTGREES